MQKEFYLSNKFKRALSHVIFENYISGTLENFYIDPKEEKIYSDLVVKASMLKNLIPLTDAIDENRLYEIDNIRSHEGKILHIHGAVINDLIILP